MKIYHLILPNKMYHLMEMFKYSYRLDVERLTVYHSPESALLNYIYIF